MEGPAARRPSGAIDFQMLPVREKNGEQASQPPQAPLALTNGEEDVSTQLGKALPTRSAGASGLQTVEDSLQALREAVPQEEDKGKAPQKPPAVLKCPAGAGSAGSRKQSAVSAGDSDERHRGMKRPAACNQQRKTRPPESPA